EELGYDKASAYRRLTAMRALGEMPEVEKKRNDGSLNLSTLCQVQQVIRQEEKSREVPIEEKRQLLQMIENKSQSQAERLLAEAKPAAMQAVRESRRSSEQALPKNRHEVRFVISEEVYLKWQKLKDLRSHASFDRSSEELLEYLIELGLDRLDPERREARRESRRAKAENASSEAAKPTTGRAEKPIEGVGVLALLESPKPSASPTPKPITSHTPEPCATSSQTPKPSASASPTPHFPRPLGDRIHVRDGRRSVFVSPITGRQCDATHGLEIDHIQPVSSGGQNHESNLRL